MLIISTERKKKLHIKTILKTSSKLVVHQSSIHFVFIWIPSHAGFT